MSENDLSQFIGQYRIQKTLRNRLIPVGRTQEFIEQRGLISEDEQRAKDYKFLKEMIDIFHEDFINTTLGDPSNYVNWDSLAEAIDANKQGNPENKVELSKKVEDLQDKKRKEIGAFFSNRKEFGLLFNAKLIKEVLPLFFQNSPEVLEVLKGFEGFTTYFTGFFENRKNVYTDEAHSTSITYRIVNTNFSIYLENINTLKQIKKQYPKALANALQQIAEELQIEKIEEFFTVAGFNKVMIQKGIDRYNEIIGGQSLENRKKIQGINECVNLAQQSEGENRHKLKLRPLYKQILSDRKTNSFVYDKFEFDEDVYRAILRVSDELITPSENLGLVSPLKKAIDLLNHISNYDGKRIFLHTQQIPKLSSLVFGQWSIINDALETCVDQRLGPTVGLNKRQAESWRKKKYFSLSEIQSVLELSEKAFNLNPIGELVIGIDEYVDATCAKISQLAQNSTSHIKMLLEDEASIELIKNYLDRLQDCLRLLRLFNVTPDENRDTEFYADFDEVLSIMDLIIPLYNQVRNYITQKPYSEIKFKMNFENATLCNGWDLNKESDNTATLLKKENSFYLAIMDVNHRKVFVDAPEVTTSNTYLKMVYKLLPGPNKMLPKVFFAKSNLELYQPSDEIMRIYKQGTFKKGDSFSLVDCHKLIDYYKECIEIHPDWSQFHFEFSPTPSYSDISGFFSEVQQQGYKLSFISVDASYIDQMVNEGNLYLFQVFNKDFSAYSTGRKNLHTLYFENIFTKENLKDVVIKLDGEAELFYRPKSIEKPVVHKAGKKLINRTYETIDSVTQEKQTKRIPENVYLEISEYINGEIEETSLGQDAKDFLAQRLVKFKDAKHDIVKDRRYTQEQYFFHVPITINFKASNSSGFNSKVLDYIDGNRDIKIIGIDRGERHLLYYTLMDQNGRIVEQNSLNYLDGIDYREKLHQKEIERDSARKNWKSINKIADLKQGYLSAVVNKLAKMMIDNNAILVMEDLNFGFKRGRFKVEKQVYQRFEKQLIDKLNYFALKPGGKDGAEGVAVNQIGGVLRGYQLAAPFTSFEKLGKQSGFIFYVPAWNTSQIDPTTGFCDLFNWNKESADIKCFFSKMNSISYNAEQNYFEFSFDYSNYHLRCLPTKTKWVVCSHGNSRIITVPSTSNSGHNYTVAEIDVTKELITLLEKASIDYQSGNDLRNAIEENTNKKFEERLFKLFRILMRIRYSTPSNNPDPKDLIISPVMNEEGEFFVSNKEAIRLPENADANGAYNISLKGLQLIKEQIKINERNGLRGIDYPNKPNEEWLRFIQNREWEK